MLSCITQKYSSTYVGYKTGLSDVYMIIFPCKLALPVATQCRDTQKFMHDLPNVQMLLSATKNARNFAQRTFIRELFGNQLPPPYNFSKTFLPSSPKAFPLPFSLTIFTMNELLPESILFLQITWFFFNTTQRLKDTRCILAYHRSSPVGWFPV